MKFRILPPQHCIAEKDGETSVTAYTVAENWLAEQAAAGFEPINLIVTGTAGRLELATTVAGAHLVLRAAPIAAPEKGKK